MRINIEAAILAMHIAVRPPDASARQRVLTFDIVRLDNLTRWRDRQSIELGGPKAITSEEPVYAICVGGDYVSDWSAESTPASVTPAVDCKVAFVRNKCEDRRI